MLQLIIACRHGDYAGGGLTNFGKEQSARLADCIKERINGADSVVLVASDYQRAIETAAIIGKAIGAEPQTSAVLCGDCFEDGERQMTALVHLAGDAKVIVAVTHSEAPAGIVHAFSKKHFGGKFYGGEIAKGTALCLCLQSKKIDQVP